MFLIVIHRKTVRAIAALFLQLLLQSVVIILSLSVCLSSALNFLWLGYALEQQTSQKAFYATVFAVPCPYCALVWLVILRRLCKAS